MSSFVAPKTFRAAVVNEVGGKFELETREWVNPKAGEVVVKMLACGVCHSDAVAVYGLIGGFKKRCPGHEIVGDVVAVGEGEQEFKPGQRVGAGWHGGHCGHCIRCRAGDFVTCVNQVITGAHVDGGYQEYVVIRSEALVRVPEDLDPAEAAPLLCAGLTVYNAMRKADILPGEICAVLGLGGLGAYAVQYSRAMGFKTVAISRGDDKRKLALEELGAHHYIDSSQEDPAQALQKMGGARVIVGCAPSAKAMSGIIPGLAVNGQLLALAVDDKGEDVQYPLSLSIFKRLSVKGSPVGSSLDAEETCAFSKLTNTKAFVQRYTLDQANEAFGAMINGTARFRSVIVF